MLQLTFNEKEERLLRAYRNMDKRLRSADYKPADYEKHYRHFNIMQNAVAAMMAAKIEGLPWEEE